MREYTVVIAEDEEIILQSLIRLPHWKELGFSRVIGARNGQQGLESIKEHRPDLVVTDVKMPFLDGIGMLEKSIEEYGYKAVIISGYEEFSFAKRAISLGVSEYLLKPIDIEELEGVVRRLLDKLPATRRQSELEALPESCREQARAMLDIDAVRRAPIHNRDVLSLLDYISEHFAERFSLSQLSEQYHISSSYLNGKFKNATGYALNDFVNRYRILRSMLLLTGSDLRVYEVAQAVGFEDYKYFIMVFKKYLGVSPAKFFEISQPTVPEPRGSAGTAQTEETDKKE